jgi:hypothetical protein
MIAPTIVEQTGLFATLLLVITFAMLPQLLSSEKRGRIDYARIGLFTASGLLLLISAWISLWLALALDPWREVQAQGEIVPEHVVRITTGLANWAVWPFLLGTLAFFGGTALTGWIHSKVVGSMTVVAVILAVIAMVAVWSVISPALRPQ